MNTNTTTSKDRNKSKKKKKKNRDNNYDDDFIGCICHHERINQKSSHDVIKIGEMRKYCVVCKKFSSWYDITIPLNRTNYNKKNTKGKQQDGIDDYDNNINNNNNNINMGDSYKICLNRGGAITLYPNIVTEKFRKKLKRQIENSSDLFRQYKHQSFFLEPRIHVLLTPSTTKPAAVVVGKNNNNKKKRSDLSLNNNNENGKDTNKNKGVVVSSEVPGYKYHGTLLKGVPMNEKLSEVDSLAHKLAGHFKLPESRWNIGVNMLAYRNGKDKINWHSDDTQDESLVLAIIVDISNPRHVSSGRGNKLESSSRMTRTIKFRPKNKDKINNKRRYTTTGLGHGDEEFNLNIPHGFGYKMDGAMQCKYEHAVPEDRNFPDARRLVLIFRQGKEKLVSVDSGQPLKEILPEGSDIFTPMKERDSVIYGPMLHVLVEGTKLYTRRELYNICAHQSDRRGISGNARDGCDSIIVATEDGNSLQVFDYLSNTKQGAGAMLRSYELQKPIRVFRSSRLHGKFAPPMKGRNNTQYRYDGLYKIKQVTCSDKGAIHRRMMKDHQQRYRFELHRMVDENKLTADALEKAIVSSRRKPRRSQRLETRRQPANFQHHPIIGSKVGAFVREGIWLPGEIVSIEKEDETFSCMIESIENETGYVDIGSNEIDIPTNNIWLQVPSEKNDGVVYLRGPGDKMVEFYKSCPTSLSEKDTVYARLPDKSYGRGKVVAVRTRKGCQSSCNILFNDESTDETTFHRGPKGYENIILIVNEDFEAVDCDNSRSEVQEQSDEEVNRGDKRKTEQQTLKSPNKKPRTMSSPAESNSKTRTRKVSPQCEVTPARHENYKEKRRELLSTLKKLKDSKVGVFAKDQGVWLPSTITSVEEEGESIFCKVKSIENEDGDVELKRNQNEFPSNHFQPLTEVKAEDQSKIVYLNGPDGKKKEFYRQDPSNLQVDDVVYARWGKRNGRSKYFYRGRIATSGEHSCTIVFDDNRLGSKCVHKKMDKKSKRKWYKGVCLVNRKL